MMWKPFDFGEPRIGSRVLVTDGERVTIGIIHTTDLFGAYPKVNLLVDYQGVEWKFGKITHWMELPEPPKDNQSKSNEIGA